MGRNDIRPFDRSLRDYERWLASQLDDVWEDDVKRKHKKMRESAFVFLRATYWRWAETILTICDDLATAPAVIGIGDIHLENYGVWRDREGRLVWGVNDLDEAAEMPYAVDVVRLATSAVLSLAAKRSARKEICANILEGYRRGLAAPRPFVLDEDHMWLRGLFAVVEDERHDFWKKIDKLDEDTGIAARYRKPIENRRPDPNATIEKFARRSAGTGSLGRPRWVAVGRWCGGRFIREAKAIVPSAWYLAHRRRARGHPPARVAAGRYRAADPWDDTRRDVSVRRLAPNTRKIEVKDHADDLADPVMLRSMGYELANVHLGTGDARKAIEKDLAQRGDKWLARSAKTAAGFVNDDFEAWARVSGRRKQVDRS